MIWPARGDDDSSGVSSGSSACVSDGGSGGARRLEDRASPPSGDAEPAGTFSVFGELDLFLEILETQKRLQQAPQTEVGDVKGQNHTVIQDHTAVHDHGAVQEHNVTDERPVVIPLEDQQSPGQFDRPVEGCRNSGRSDPHSDAGRGHAASPRTQPELSPVPDHTHPSQGVEPDLECGETTLSVQEDLAGLLRTIDELLEWLGRKETEMRLLEPLLGDVTSLQRQRTEVRSLLADLQEHEPVPSGALSTAWSVRPEISLHRQASFRRAHSEVSDGRRRRLESQTSEGSHDPVKAVGREATVLQDRLYQLDADARRYQCRVDDALEKMHVFERCLRDTERRLSEMALDDGDVTDGRLLEVERGVDDVTEQATMLANNSVPLSSDYMDRLESVTSRLRSLTRTATPGGSTDLQQLSRSVEPPWERAVTDDHVPYYLHHGERRTQWDHPRLTQITDSFTQFDSVRFSAYRTALKLRRLQRALMLYRLPLAEAVLTFESEARRLPADGSADVAAVAAVLAALYGRLESTPDQANAGPLQLDLCISWLLRVYDSQRTGHIAVTSFKIAIATLCKARLEEKYRYMFQLAADSRRRLDERQLGQLLLQMLQLPAQLGEAAAFSEAAIPAAVGSCFRAAEADADAAQAGTQPTLDEQQLLEWLRAEPQTLVWLPVLHRVAGAEAARHQARCNACKHYPIAGFRYRCLKCFNFDMCQTCFFTGRVSKSHKLNHPMHEYCTESSSVDDIKDFTKSFRNKFKPKHYFQKHLKLGYLPVQPVSEYSPVANRDNASLDGFLHCRGPHLSSEDNLNESYPDSEEELHLLTQYCLGLSPEEGQRTASDGSLRNLIRHLEHENRALQAEYQRLSGHEDADGGGGAAWRHGRTGSQRNGDPEPEPEPEQEQESGPEPEPEQEQESGSEPEPEPGPVESVRVGRARRAGGGRDSSASSSGGADSPGSSGDAACRLTNGSGAGPAGNGSGVASELNGEHCAADELADGPGGVADPERRPPTPLHSRVQALDQHNRELGHRLSKLRRALNGGVPATEASVQHRHEPSIPPVSARVEGLLNGGTSLARSSTLQTRAVVASHLATDLPSTDSKRAANTNGGGPVSPTLSLVDSTLHQPELSV